MTLANGESVNSPTLRLRLAEVEARLESFRGSGFEATYGTKFAKAVAKIIDDLTSSCLLRLPCRTLDPFAHNESHRFNLRHRAQP